MVRASAMTREVFVSGLLDDPRSSEIRFLEEAAAIGQVRVLLWSDPLAKRLQASAPGFPESERLYFVRAIRHVHEAEIIDELSDANALPKRLVQSGAVWALRQGEDTSAKRAFCKAHGLDYYIVPEG